MRSIFMLRKFVLLPLLATSLMGGMGCEAPESEMTTPSDAQITPIKENLVETNFILLPGKFETELRESPTPLQDSSSIEVHIKLGTIFVYDSPRPGRNELPAQTYCLTEDLQEEFETFLYEPVCNFRHGEICTMDYRNGYAEFSESKLDGVPLIDMGGGNSCTYNDFCDVRASADLKELIRELRDQLPSMTQACQLLYPAGH